MTRVEEIWCEFYSKMSETDADDMLSRLVSAVRDEEWGRAVAAGLVEDTACPRCSTEAWNKTRYCPWTRTNSLQDALTSG